MSAVINVDFAVDRWADTCIWLFKQGRASEIDVRTANLPAYFKVELIDRVKQRKAKRT